jgi:hypothetical protein
MNDMLSFSFYPRKNESYSRTHAHNNRINANRTGVLSSGLHRDADRRRPAVNWLYNLQPKVDYRNWLKCTASMSFHWKGFRGFLTSSWPSALTRLCAGTPHSCRSDKCVQNTIWSVQSQSESFLWTHQLHCPSHASKNLFLSRAVMSRKLLMSSTLLS